MYKNFTISLVIPCYNEQKSIGKLLKLAPDFIDKTIIVDNCSTDTTAVIAKNSGAHVVYEPLKGYGNAYKCGFAACDTDIIVTMDADLTYPVEAISSMIDTLATQNLDFISGNRFPLKNPEAMSLTRVLGNKILTFLAQRLFNTKINDSQSGMWVFKRKCLEKFTLRGTGMSLSQEIKIKTIKTPELEFAEFAITYEPRMGKSKLSPVKDGLLNLISLFCLYFELNKKRH